MPYKRPHFVREESWRYARVKESWRSPRGKTSRVRRSKEGWPPVVKIGYSRPKATRGGHPSGLVEVMVWRPEDLAHINPRTQAARIAHNVGERKRVMILDQAKKATIIVLNPGVKKEPEVTPEVAAEATAPTGPTEVTEPTAEAAEITPTAAEEATAEKKTKEASEPETTSKSPKKRSDKARKKDREESKEDKE